MPYDLDQFVSDCRSILKRDPGPSGREEVRTRLERLLANADFIEEYCGAQAPRGLKVLYEDPELGFCVCGHVYDDGGSIGKPHDHGSSWAIYGVAVGDTEMVDWRIVKRAEGDAPNLVEPAKTYLMRPGDSHLYDVGAVHSPNRRGLTKLVRIEGKNLDNVKRSNIKAVEHATTK